MSGKESGPITSLSYQILLALAVGDLHGYGIIKDIEQRSGPGAVPSTGALYLALQRLEQAGMIEESPERPAAAADDARRRYYRLTVAGRSAATDETERWVALLGVARERKLITNRALAKLVPSGATRAR